MIIFTTDHFKLKHFSVSLPKNENLGAVGAVRIQDAAPPVSEAVPRIERESVFKFPVHSSQLVNSVSSDHIECVSISQWDFGTHQDRTENPTRR